MSEQLVKGYAWREGSRFSADPNAVGRALDELATRLGRPFDGLTADDVVDAAKDAGSPLHGLFEWDDEKAAIEYRLEQSRLVLRSVVRKFVVDQQEVVYQGRRVRRDPGPDRPRHRRHRGEGRREAQEGNTSPQGRSAERPPAAVRLRAYR